jgi:hypothetical protein
MDAYVRMNDTSIKTTGPHLCNNLIRTGKSTYSPTITGMNHRLELRFQPGV